MSMADCPCITDSSLAALSEVKSIKLLNLNHCDKITDNGELLHLPHQWARLNQAIAFSIISTLAGGVERHCNLFFAIFL